MENRVHNLRFTKINIKSSVVDLGFPRGGGANPPGGFNIRFCQIFPKTA